MTRAVLCALLASCAGSAPAPRASEASSAPPVPPVRDEEVAAQPPPRPTQPERRVVVWPPECDGEGRWDDPQAPPPDMSAPMEVAVVTSDVRFAGESRNPVLRAVEARLHARDPQLRMVRREEVAAAERLAAERRWIARGPVCGQPPPLPALLAGRHQHLVLATVESLCEVGGGSCWLQVAFSRAGSDDPAGLPPVLDATLTGPPEEVRSWVEAASKLDDSQMAGRFGHGGVGTGPTLIIRGNQDDDSWLRLTPTLNIRNVAIAGCTPSGISSFRLRWTVSPTGEPLDVDVTPVTPPSASPEAVACLTEVLRQTSWPCPRSGAATPVELTVCVRH